MNTKTNVSDSISATSISELLNNKSKMTLKPTLIEKRRDLVIYPNDMFSNVWNILILVSLAYLAFVLPLSLVDSNLEKDNKYFFYFSLSANLIFFVDIFINFFTAFMDESN